MEAAKATSSLISGEANPSLIDLNLEAIRVLELSNWKSSGRKGDVAFRQLEKKL